jgi:hypothetical protein
LLAGRCAGQNISFTGRLHHRGKWLGSESALELNQ